MELPIQTITTEESIHTKGKWETETLEHTHSEGHDNTDSHQDHHRTDLRNTVRAELIRFQTE